MKSRKRRLAVLVLVALSLLAPTASWARSAPDVTLRPAALSRGDGPGVPFVLGTTIIDGNRRVQVDAREVQLLGVSDGDYVAVVYRNGRGYGVERIAPTGTRTQVVGRFRGEMTLSRDGAQLVETRVSDVEPRSVVRVLDPTTGDLQQRRVFRGHARVLDADAGTLVLGARAPAWTKTWTLETDTVQRVLDQEAYFVDVRADRFATNTREVVDGGCSVLRVLSAPRTRLWRSCEHRVAAVSSDARRVLSTTIQLDGPLGYYQLRRGDGRLLATYRAPAAFGPAAFEQHTALMTTYTERNVALVRCSKVVDCERASRLQLNPWAS